MWKSIASFAALIGLAIAIHFLTWSEPVRMIMVCDTQENCIDLYGKPGIAISMGIDHYWGIAGVKDPSGHCRSGCTVKKVYDQAGNYDFIQESYDDRPKFEFGSLYFPHGAHVDAPPL